MIERYENARYENLLAVSGSLGTYGGIVKVLGFLLGVGAVVGGYVATGGLGIAIGGVGIFLGVTLHGMGTFIAATGEGLLALADIATNTAGATASKTSSSPSRIDRLVELSASLKRGELTEQDYEAKKAEMLKEP